MADKRKIPNGLRRYNLIQKSVSKKGFSKGDYLNTVGYIYKNSRDMSDSELNANMDKLLYEYDASSTFNKYDIKNYVEIEVGEPYYKLIDDSLTYFEEDTNVKIIIDNAGLTPILGKRDNALEEYRRYYLPYFRKLEKIGDLPESPSASADLSVIYDDKLKDYVLVWRFTEEYGELPNARDVADAVPYTETTEEPKTTKTLPKPSKKDATRQKLADVRLSKKEAREDIRLFKDIDDKKELAKAIASYKKLMEEEKRLDKLL